MIVIFFFNDTATTEIYTLSLHDALPISGAESSPPPWAAISAARPGWHRPWPAPASRGPPNDGDRKSTRLNSSHGYISYAVFCLKKIKLIKYFVYADDFVIIHVLSITEKH